MTRFGIELASIIIPDMTYRLLQPKFPHLWGVSGNEFFRWKWDLGGGHLFIPFKYQCDGASIPFRFYDQVDPITALPGSIPHDVMYETQCGFRPPVIISNFDSDPTKPSHRERRARADALLHAFWLASGMDPIMAEKGYLAVRLCGEPAWISEEPVKSDTPMWDAVIAQIQENKTIDIA